MKTRSTEGKHPIFQRRHHHRAGVSFVEILLAILIIVFGLLGTLNIIDAGRRNNATAVNRAVAVQLAEMKSAELQTAGYDALAQRLGGSAETVIPSDEAKSFPTHPDYTWQATLRKDDDSSGLAYNIRVQWNTGQPAGSSEVLPSKNFIELSGILYPQRSES